MRTLFAAHSHNYDTKVAGAPDGLKTYKSDSVFRSLGCESRYQFCYGESNCSPSTLGILLLESLELVGVWHVARSLNTLSKWSSTINPKFENVVNRLGPRWLLAKDTFTGGAQSQLSPDQ